MVLRKKRKEMCKWLLEEISTYRENRDYFSVEERKAIRKSLRDKIRNTGEKVYGFIEKMNNE